METPSAFRRKMGGRFARRTRRRENGAHVCLRAEGSICASVKQGSVPTSKDPKGETHEDLGFFGYDRALKKLTYRQFHVEGFVIHYSLQSISEDVRTFNFTSTAIENISPGWVARETYRFLSNDEFIETFALAGPGKESNPIRKLAFVEKGKSLFEFRRKI